MPLSKALTKSGPLAFAAVLGLALAPQASATPVDPFALYDGDIQFEVMRNGSTVGSHTATFRQDGAKVTVESLFNIEIDFLFFTAYRFDYASQAVWSGGQLESMSVDVDQNGDLHAFELALTPEGYRVTSATQDYLTDGPLYPTNHWNMGVLPQRKVLNTLTGNINLVEIVEVGPEEVVTENGTITATRYAYTGELETEVWYDDQGRWVKMQFEGTDGSNIEYICRRCQGGTPAAANVAAGS